MMTTRGGAISRVLGPTLSLNLMSTAQGSPANGSSEQQSSSQAQVLPQLTDW